MAGIGLGNCTDLIETDKLYLTLPIYHATGCCIGLGFAILFGSTIGSNKIKCLKI